MPPSAEDDTNGEVAEIFAQFAAVTSDAMPVLTPDTWLGDILLGPELTAEELAGSTQVGWRPLEAHHVDQVGQGQGRRLRVPHDQGTGTSGSLKGAAELAELIEPMGSSEALALGRLRTGLHDKVRVIRKDELDDATPSGTIARTTDHIVFAPGKPAFLLLDHDRKGMPREVRDKLKEAKGFWRAVTSAVPALASAARVERCSTSAGTLSQEDGRAVQRVAEQTCLRCGDGRRRHRACTEDLTGSAVVGWLRLRRGRRRRPDPHSVNHRRVGVWS